MKPLSIAGAVALLSACASEPVDQGEKAKASPVRSVKVGRVALRSIGGPVSASGLLVAREEAAISPQLSGYRVLRVLADEGEVVRAGQMLAVLDSKLLEARLDQARAALAEAEARAAQAAGAADRVKGLEGTGVLADEQIADRGFQEASARAAIGVARAQLRDLQTQRTEMVIRAPVGGMILQRTVRPGDVAAPGGEPMFRIARDRLVELNAELPEDALDGLVAGARVRVALPAGGAIEGKVRFISPRVDPQTKLGQARVSLPVDSRLRPGGFARATLVRAAAPVGAVPEAAVEYEASGPLVVTIADDGRAKRVAVRTGARADGWVALVQGPPVGTRVALGGGAFLLDGDRARIVAGR